MTSKYDSTKKEELIMIESEEFDVSQAKETALQLVRKKLSTDYEYTVTTKDQGDYWEFVILPKGRVRGGGAQITVSKSSKEITKVLFLQ